MPNAESKRESYSGIIAKYVTYGNDHTFSSVGSSGPLLLEGSWERAGQDQVESRETTPEEVFWYPSPNGYDSGRTRSLT